MSEPTGGRAKAVENLGEAACETVRAGRSLGGSMASAFRPLIANMIPRYEGPRTRHGSRPSAFRRSARRRRLSISCGLLAKEIRVSRLGGPFRLLVAAVLSATCTASPTTRAAFHCDLAR
jgi:hypothetical protein